MKPERSLLLGNGLMILVTTIACSQASADRDETKSVYDEKQLDPQKRLHQHQSATQEILHNKDEQLSRWVQ